MKLSGCTGTISENPRRAAPGVEGSFVQHFIVSLGYVAIFVLMIAESACVPVPSEVTMLFAGAVAGGAIAGTRLNIVAVIAIGTLGNVVGSYLAWAVGRQIGPAAAQRWGHHVGLGHNGVDRAQQWFERHGAASVFLGRLVPVIRTFISLPAGFARMPATRFGLYTVAGCLPWTAALALTGYVIGPKWDRVAKGFDGPTYVVAAATALTVIAAVVIARRRNGSPPDESPPPRSRSKSPETQATDGP